MLTSHYKCKRNDVWCLCQVQWKELNKLAMPTLPLVRVFHRAGYQFLVAVEVSANF